jgi:adenylylsulfate kinase
MKILIMGLPGSGKTWLASRLQKRLNCAWFNGDEVRRMSNDWDFGEEARLRQARRMNHYATFEEGIVLCDFICPTTSTRSIFNPDMIIWVNTLDESQYEDTNKLFEPPSMPDITIKHLMSDGEVNKLADMIGRTYNEF